MVRNKEGHGPGKFFKFLRTLKGGSEQAFRTNNQNPSLEKPEAFDLSWKFFDRRRTKQTLTTPGIDAVETDNQPISAPLANIQPRNESDPFGDRKRTELRYNEAVKQLENALKLRRPNWETFETPNLTNISDNDPIPQLRVELAKMLDSRKSSIKNQDAWSKCKDSMTRIFNVMSPFAKNFLRIAKDAQSIPILNPYGVLCNGLLLLIMIADREIARRKIIEEKLDYISRQFGQLQIAKRVLDGDPPLELVNRAIDVKSAAFVFLAAQICHESRGLRNAFASALFKDDDDFESADAKLQAAVNEFNSTLSNFGHCTHFHTLEVVEGIASTLASAGLGSSRNVTSPSSIIPSVFSVRYERNPYFTGRDEFLERLRKELTDKKPKRYNHRISLHGLGGVGKTQIALEYAYRHESDYNYVFWISAADQAQLLSGFRDIAKVTRCVEINGEPQELAKSVLKWLQTTESCLLIIDNLDDITIIDGYLPSTNGSGHALITTRNRNSDGIPAVGMEVDVMKSDECVQLLVDRIMFPAPVNPQIQNEAQKIVRELGFLPLAIEQAAAYIRTSQKIDGFLATYQNNRREVLGWRPKGNYSYNHTIATTWRMSLEHLQSSCSNSIALIRLLAFLNPDEILIEYIQSGREGLRPELQAIIGNDFYLREGLNALESFSLIRIFGEGQKISIHRLLQTVIQDDLDSLHLTQILSDIVQLGLRSFPYISDGTNRESCRRYRSQVIACLERGSRTKGDSQWLKLLDRVEDYLWYDGFYVDALHWSKLSLDTRVEILGPEHPVTLSNMIRLASLYWSLGRWKDAAQLYGKSLENLKRVLGLEHPDTLQSMNGLALSYTSLGRSKEASQLHEKVLEIQKRVLGLEHPHTLLNMHNLALSYSNLGRHEDSAQLDEEILEIRKRVFGLEHQVTLWSMNNLAISYLHLRRSKEAKKLHEETLEIRKRVLGLEHPDTLVSMNGLASSYLDLGWSKEATQLLEETLKIRKRVLGLEHPHTLGSMGDLAVSYFNLGRLEEATQLHVEALEIQKRVLGLEHPDTLWSMNNLASSYSGLGRSEEAAQLQQKILNAQRRALGPDTTQSMDELGS